MSKGGLRIQGIKKKSSGTTPLISIITIVFNGEEYLENTIKSVINQAYNNVEYLIIDGQSTDNTIEIIKKYENRIDFWISKPDNGIYDAMNKGIFYSNGKYILFLNAQDELLVDLNKIINVLREDFSFIYGKANLIDMQNNQKIWGRPITSEQIFFHHMPTCHQAIFYNKKYIQPYDTNFKIIADRVLTYEMLIKYGKEKTKFVNEIICNYYFGGFSDQNNLLFIKEKNIFRKMMNKGTWLSDVIFILNKNFRYKYPLFGYMEKLNIFKLYRYLINKYYS